MKEHLTEDPAASREVIEMITVANEYCLFFEKAESYGSEQIMEYFRKIAPLIYLKGALLPGTNVTDSRVAERFVTEEQWEGVFKTLREQFGDADVYYEHDHNFDSVQASLSDNMADIYQDMKDFIMLYQRNTLAARQNAVSLLRDLYQWRWGPALLSALGAVHNIVFRENIDPGLFPDDVTWD